jgi:hypothetical protein
VKQNLFDVGSELNTCKISLPNFEFLQESMFDIEIKWNFIELQSEAVFTIMDKSDFLQSFKTYKVEDNIVKFYIEDKRIDPKTKKNTIFQKPYVITQIVEVKDDESKNKSYQIKCLDQVSYLLKNTYFSKGYKNKKLSEIIQDLFTKYKIKDFISKESEIKINDSKEIPKNLVIPSHISLYDFLMFQCNKEGYILYQDKFGIYGKHITELYRDKLNKVDFEKTFKQDVDSPVYEFKIANVTSSFNNNFLNLGNPTTITYVYNPLTKSIIEKKQNFNEIYSKINFTNSNESYIQNTVGENYNIGEVNLSDNALIKETYLNFLKNNKSDLILTGSLAGNKLLELRDIQIIGSTNTTDGLTKGNETLNGNYLVLSISDKILNNKFIQNIVVGRINNTNKANKINKG